MNQTVDLYTMLSLTGALNNNDMLVYLRKDYEHEFPGNPSEILTVKEIRQKYDMRRTKVVFVSPYYSNYEYEGLLFTVRDSMTKDEVLKWIHKSGPKIKGLRSFMILYMDCVEHLHQVRINYKGAGPTPRIICKMEQWFHNKGLYMLINAVGNVFAGSIGKAELFCEAYKHLLENARDDENRITELIELVYSVPGQFIRQTENKDSASFTYKEVMSKQYQENLTKEELEKESEFHVGRTMFAFIDGHVQYRTYDNRDHAHWLHEDYGIDESGFEAIDRGYIRPVENNNVVNIMVYRGIGHNRTTVTLSMIRQLTHLAVSVYGKKFLSGKKLNIYSGVRIGKVGEIWEPLDFITSVPC